MRGCSRELAKCNTMLHGGGLWRRQLRYLRWGGHWTNRPPKTVKANGQTTCGHVLRYLLWASIPPFWRSPKEDSRRTYLVLPDFCWVLLRTNIMPLQVAGSWIPLINRQKPLSGLIDDKPLAYYFLSPLTSWLCSPIWCTGTAWWLVVDE